MQDTCWFRLASMRFLYTILDYKARYTWLGGLIATTNYNVPAATGICIHRMAALITKLEKVIRNGSIGSVTVSLNGFVVGVVNLCSDFFECDMFKEKQVGVVEFW